MSVIEKRFFALRNFFNQQFLLRIIQFRLIKDFRMSLNESVSSGQAFNDFHKTRASTFWNPTIYDLRFIFSPVQKWYVD